MDPTENLVKPVGPFSEKKMYLIAQNYFVPTSIIE
jgi:hypothetical protein